jgi:hypothetical protein
MNNRQLTLKCPRYEIDLVRCLTSAQVTDWIFQITGKAWADDRTLAGLIRALDDILHPQGTLCSFEQPREITIPQLRELVREARKERAESLRVYGELAGSGT